MQLIILQVSQGLAFLWVLFEPTRRMIISYNDHTKQFEVGHPADIPYASHTICALKLWRNGVTLSNSYLVTLENIFSPDSELVVLTREGVASLSNTKRTSILDNSFIASISRVQQKSKDKQATPSNMVNYNR